MDTTNPNHNYYCSITWIYEWKDVKVEKSNLAENMFERSGGIGK